VSEDSKRAHELVMEDIANAGREARKIGRVDVATFIELNQTEATNRTLITIVIGTRDQLTKREADSAGKAFRTLRSRHPYSRILLCIPGYDQDPRELWDFPEVCKYVRRFSRAAGLNDWRAASEVPWADPSWGVAFLAACGAFGDDHPFIIQKPTAVTIQ